MKKIAIANNGGAGQGKSTTIKNVYYKLRDKYDPTNKPICDGGDIKAIIVVDEIKIGIESQGDPDSRHQISIPQFVIEGCDVIVSACRTRGETFDRMWHLKNDGYSVVWASNLRSQDKSLIDVLNQKYVDSIVSIVDDYISGKL